MNVNIYERIDQLKTSGALPPEDIQTFSLNNSALGGVDCPVCQNKGRIVSMKDGMIFVKECQCMEARRAKRRAKVSGLDSLLEEYTFKKFKTPNKEIENVRNKALEYLKFGDGKWFYVCGTPGAGKTHICTAICNQLISSGKKVKYVLWREMAQKLKAAINDKEYEEIMNSLKKADVLYIDDFLKGSISAADMNRAFEIINARYNLTKKRTIISTERDLVFIRNLDPAVADRIYQRSKDYCFKMQSVNWRA